MKKFLLAGVTCAAAICLAAPAPALALAVAPTPPAAYIAANRDGALVTYTLASPGDAARGDVIARVVEPEISGWIMAMMAFAGLGAAIRAARQRLMRSVTTYAV